MSSSYKKRKIVTIAEDEEKDYHPKFTREIRKAISPAKVSNRSLGIDKEEKSIPQKPTSRLNFTRYSKETKPNSKSNSGTNRKDAATNNVNYKNKHSNNQNQLSEKTKFRNSNEECELTRNLKSVTVPQKTSVSKRLAKTSESDNKIYFIKNKLTENLKNNVSSKISVEKSKTSKSLPQQSRSKTTIYLNEIQAKNKPVTIIRVPLEEKYRKDIINKEIINILNHPIDKLNKVHQNKETETIFNLKNVSIGTDPLPKTDQVTEIDYNALRTVSKYVNGDDLKTNIKSKTFDDLNIPDVSLTKEKYKYETPKDVNKLGSQSLPNLQIPQFKMAAHKKENNSSDNIYKNSSYLIGRATLTYTTKQKINFHVVSSSEEASNLSSSPISYPMTVVSVFKEEMKKREINSITETCTYKNQEKLHTNHANKLNELKSVNCSYIFNSTKLLKPSDIIGTMNVNNSLLQSDYVSEQFQRELNFIDSFFESLQFLENSSLTSKCLWVNKPDIFRSDVDTPIKHSECHSFLSRLENEIVIDDSETITSKNLCLLNLLIRDEQRRAKNLLFVLKMREDALKDFTKSQILWLEKKKKQDNTDISTLKKKQRGALLKLQHECGEMQRMRKALLTLSEKRKAALMKTKMNLELKLNNNVRVDLLEKKKLKRNNVADRCLAPVKCFDLLSSGCDESTARPKFNTPVQSRNLSEIPVSNIKSAEKCIQTGDSVIGTVLVDQSTDTAAENFVVVDGSYLNILFHNLSLPKIFSNGKNYEVNEEALKNIVNSANINSSLTNCNNVERLMDQIKNRDLDRSSSPSTAHSLVEEFDQYYRGLAENDKSSVYSSQESPDQDFNDSKVYELKDSLVQTCTSESIKNCINSSIHETSTAIVESTNSITSSPTNISIETYVDELTGINVESQSEKNIDAAQVASQTGPLPVPPGAAAVDSSSTELATWLQPKTSTLTISAESISSSQALRPSVSSMSSLTSPVHCEAEELRRQQLAIEREIKALEEQQCQLLVVREIPDKPPPPYTPPLEAKQIKPTHMFLPDQVLEEKINKHITNSEDILVNNNNPLEVFIKDFCEETVKQQKLEQSNKPWDACNLLPQKPETDMNKLIKKTSTELKDVLTGVPPTVVSGVSARRSDHIDDILFAEWRRCEPEWTTLQADEVIVKNQVFESIFQKVLSEAVDEYKRTVLGVANNIIE